MPTFPLNLRSRGVKFELRSHKTQFQGFLEPQKGKQDAVCISGLNIRVRYRVSSVWESHALFFHFSTRISSFSMLTDWHTHLLTHHFPGVALCVYSVEGCQCGGRCRGSAGGGGHDPADLRSLSWAQMCPQVCTCVVIHPSQSCTSFFDTDSFCSFAHMMDRWKLYWYLQPNKIYYMKSS